MGNILEITDLRVRYPDGTDAIRGLSLEAPADARIAIIGPNGAGKTSLLLAIMRGVPYEGRIVIDGVELSRRTVEDARGRCGMMFQDAEDQLFMPTLLDDVAFGPLNQGCDAVEAHERATAAIATVGLAGLETRPAHHMSGGQKRCAALATILSMRVKLLLLDEPGANLDFRSKRRLVELLAARPEAMLLATHDLDLVRELCRTVIIMDEGRIAASGPAGEILGDVGLLAGHGLA
ncbi:MAG: energy-coupling factor ABC transporter ATP-binding protein [Phycisphaerae bacterium]